MSNAPSQLIRADKVRTPQVVDGYTPPQAADAVTLQDFQSYVVSQLRLILGSDAWTDAPQISLAQLAQGGGITPTPSPGSTFTAVCSMTDAIGNVVRPNGSGGVVTADSSFNTGFGIITQKTASTMCTVQMQGIVAGIFDDLIPNARYFLGQNGALITPPLTNPGLLYVQPIGVALSATQLCLAPGPAIKRDLTV